MGELDEYRASELARACVQYLYAHERVKQNQDGFTVPKEQLSDLETARLDRAKKAKRVSKKLDAYLGTDEYEEHYPRHGVRDRAEHRSM